MGDKAAEEGDVLDEATADDGGTVEEELDAVLPLTTQSKTPLHNPLKLVVRLGGGAVVPLLAGERSGV